MKILNGIHLLPLLALVFFSACKKDDTKPQDNLNASDLEISMDNTYADDVFTDVFNIVDESSRESDGIYKKSELQEVYGSCATLIVDTAGDPTMLTIDFGATNCTGIDGRLRRGKIIATYTGRYRDSGTVISVILQDFYLNDEKVEGQKTITNQGRDKDGNITFDIDVSNGKITRQNGKTIEWNSKRTRKWIEGENTLLNIFDDVYEISGNADGKTTSGLKYTVKITKPLNVKVGCRWIRSGTINITPEGVSTRKIDYGDGNCDRVATVTVNGKSYQFEMR